MTSWRDGVPEPVQSDFDALTEVMLARAEGFLRKRGELAPFGAAVEGEDPPKEFYPIMAQPPADHPKPSEEAIAIMLDGLRHDRDRWRVLGIAYDVVLSDDADAVAIDLEHRDGHALRVLVAYQRSRLRRKVGFATAYPAPLEPRIWV